MKETKKIEVVIMIGPPGAGKTTYVNQHYANKGYEILSRDIIRAELGFCKNGEKFLGTPAQEEEVTINIENRLIDCVCGGKNVVIDNTHMKRKYRERIHCLLKSLDVKYTYVLVSVRDADKLYERRREDFGENAKSIIDKMLFNFEEPYPSEYDELIKVYTDEN